MRNQCLSTMLPIYSKINKHFTIIAEDDEFEGTPDERFLLFTTEEDLEYMANTTE